ncbi:APC family permease [Macrococcoides caseolyticum]|uniref:Amino acid permease homolog n=2 Tax=Macrococcoides caseolyticum TaxID=69966 RepID=B9E9T4_MACCJ|nr:amino acid permease [Macrococcus caseolyticus]ARQ03633.1 Serine/threonine exchanger SteT [Macrococcus caseolyticus]PKE06886.1 amino acid permease [Macrococcus caseolyticus]PKE16979.1 amino acid permease [Macrococcus caseolyticus]PKE24083.1 amino acid permease [Macrococcus caseolyticus]PKE38915.1 amino acid permease [Macrococcus caseolyticus]
MENKNIIQKNIGFFPALALVMGTVIGSGVFFKVSNITEVTGTPGMTLLVWLLGGVITICAGLTVAELAAAIPRNGGLTTYIEYTYGKFSGFLAGWAQSFIYFPAMIAAQAIVFSEQVLNLLHLKDGWIVPVAFIAVASIYLINIIGSKTGGILQSVTLVVKLIPLIVIIIFGLMNTGDVEVSLAPNTGDTGINFFTAIGAGLLATMFAYDGWIHVGNIAGEMKNPKRDLPLAIVLGLGLVTVIYLLINATFLYTMPIEDLKGNLSAATDASEMLLGDMGGKLVTIGILISVYGALNGYTMTGMRLPYAMAEKNILPFKESFMKVTNAGIPWFSGLVQVIIGAIMITSRSFDAITNMLVFVIWAFYVMAFYAVFVLRKRESELERPYKVPLYPVIPAIAIIAGVFVMVNTLFTQPVLAIVGIIITLLGIPIYKMRIRVK